MEKALAVTGMAIFGWFFLCGFCLTNIWLIGCVPGLLMACLGMAFIEE